jgi:integrase
MTRTLTLPIEEAVAFEKVNKFLRSKARNSESTKKGYTIALAHFETFLKKNTKYNLETILDALEKKTTDVYTLLDDYIDYLRNRIDVYNGNTKLSEKTIAFYIAGVKSYLEYYDIEISSKKLRNKVTMPKILRRKKEVLNQKKIRNMLIACNNDRLKLFILVLASGGTRSMETLAIRNRDVLFEESPAKLHIIAENTKTKQDRDVYISDEAFLALRKFVESKYKDKFESIKSDFPDDLVFSSWRTGKIDPRGIYGVLHKQFASLLRKIEMAQRKDGQGIQRRKISFHLFRDYVKSTVSKHTTKDFSEYILGHSGSTYWNIEEDETRELYLKCMKYLTFLDYAVPETMGADFESKLIEKDNEIKLINQKIGKLEKLESFLKQVKGFSLSRVENDNVTLEIDVKTIEKMEKEGKDFKDVLSAMGLKPKKIKSKT